MFVDCSGTIISITIKVKDLKMLCSGMIRNAICLRLQRGWSKLIRILLVSKIFIDGKRKEHGKFIMNSFLTQTLHGTGIVSAKQIQLAAYLAQKTKTRQESQSVR